MYNTFTHDQRKSQQQEIFRSKIKDSQWQKRYRAKIQPQLLEHYEKRISSFIHKVSLLIFSQTKTPSQLIRKTSLQQQKKSRTISSFGIQKIGKAYFARGKELKIAKIWRGFRRNLEVKENVGVFNQVQSRKSIERVKKTSKLIHRCAIHI